MCPTSTGRIRENKAELYNTSLQQDPCKSVRQYTVVFVLTHCFEFQFRAYACALMHTALLRLKDGESLCVVINIRSVRYTEGRHIGPLAYKTPRYPSSLPYHTWLGYEATL